MTAEKLYQLLNELSPYEQDRFFQLVLAEDEQEEEEKEASSTSTFLPFDQYGNPPADYKGTTRGWLLMMALATV